MYIITLEFNIFFKHKILSMCIIIIQITICQKIISSLYSFQNKIENPIALLFIPKYYKHFH